MTKTIKRTPLFDVICAQKARLTDFAGWEMPVQFSGLKQEHEAVRTSVGMFDISHMGKFALEGKNLVAQLKSIVPSDLGRLQPNEAQYTVLLNQQAGIIDDVIFYYQGEDDTGKQRGMLIVNAATCEGDKAWLLENLADTEIQLTDLSLEKVLLAIQGVKAVATLQPLVGDDLSSIKAFGHLETTILGQPAFLARTGYTGEDGFEVMVAPEVGVELWNRLLDAGVTPCGLGARDTLRLEAAMALYGQDIDTTTTPLEAGLGWLVHLNRPDDFIGRSILEEQKASGVKRKLVGLNMVAKGIARHGYRVLAEGKVVGEVTSGTLGPTVGKAVALAYVDTPLAKVGRQLEIEIRGKIYPAVVVKKPFYRSPHR